MLWKRTAKDTHDEKVVEALHRIEHLLARMIERERHLILAIDTLTASVTAAGAAVTALTTTVQTAITDLNTPAGNDAEVLQQAAVVDGLTTALTALKSSLDAALVPVTPPVVTPTA